MSQQVCSHFFVFLFVLSPLSNVIFLQSLDEAKLGLFKGLDHPMSVQSRGRSWFLEGITDEMRQQFVVVASLFLSLCCPLDFFCSHEILTLNYHCITGLLCHSCRLLLSLNSRRRRDALFQLTVDQLLNATSKYLLHPPAESVASAVFAAKSEAEKVAAADATWTVKEV